MYPYLVTTASGGVGLLACRAGLTARRRGTSVGLEGSFRRWCTPLICCAVEGLPWGLLGSLKKSIRVRIVRTTEICTLRGLSFVRGGGRGAALARGTGRLSQEICGQHSKDQHTPFIIKVLITQRTSTAFPIVMHLRGAALCIDIKRLIRPSRQQSEVTTSAKIQWLPTSNVRSRQNMQCSELKVEKTES